MSRALELSIPALYDRCFASFDGRKYGDCQAE